MFLGFYSIKNFIQIQYRLTYSIVCDIVLYVGWVISHRRTLSRTAVPQFPRGSLRLVRRGESFNIIPFSKRKQKQKEPQELFLRLFLRSALMSFQSFFRNCISHSINERYSFV